MKVFKGMPSRSRFQGTTWKLGKYWIEFVWIDNPLNLTACVVSKDYGRKDVWAWRAKCSFTEEWRVE